MNNHLNQVKQQLESWTEWHDHRRIVLAVSGGVDSMVLLHTMNELNRLKQYQDKEFVVAHFNHQIRSDSDVEADMVKEKAKELGMMYFSQNWQRPNQKSTENQARQARYEFYADVLEASESKALMTAHHLNDVTETSLMRLIRGTSLKGLQSIRPNYQRILMTSDDKALVVQLMRPFIRLTKASLYEYAEECGVVYIEDPTNAEDTYLRNRVRHHIVPLMEEENPQFLRAMHGFATQLGTSYRVHFKRYLEIEPQLLMFLSPNRWWLYTPTFNQLSDAERRVYLSIFFEERLVDSLPDYNKELIVQLDHMITQETAPNMSLNLGNGWQAIKSYDKIIIQPESISEDEIYTDLNNQLVEINETNKWYQLNRQERVGIFRVIHISMALIKQADTIIPLKIDPQERLSFLIRHRQDGDIIKLAQSDGTSYHKKISRIMIDDKIPKEERDKRWLLTTSEQEVVAFLPYYTGDYPFVVGQAQATHVFLYQKNEF